jgi:bifunctional DNase/RNase
MTHDLIRNLIAETGLEVQKIIISDLLDNTFYAKVELLDKNGKTILLDSRPSDAIALALRSDCPIFVEDKVFEISNSATADEPEFETDTAVVQDDWDEFIE